MIEIAVERWPIAGAFAISRGAKTEAEVVVATITEGAHRGHGECVPYGRYGETVEGVAAAMRTAATALGEGAGRSELQDLLPPGAARNALDCALWDLEAKRAGRSAASLAGLPAPHAVETCYTISLGSPEAMALTARAHAGRPLLKLKLGGAGDPERLRAVRAAAPTARLVVDANEAWTAANFAANMQAAAETGVRLVEQPLPAGGDGDLRAFERPVPICADESFHGAEDLARIAVLYDAVNIKLDKTGGLTAALGVLAEAERRRLKVMIGCMVGTSLAMAPAMLLAQRADFVDLDGPLLLARDRVPGLKVEGSRLMPPDAALWG